MTVYSRKNLSLTLIAILLATMLATILAPAASAATLTDETTIQVATDLQFMREEEKLARDVYLTLYEEWDLQVFANIAKSEQRHMDAILTLLERYDISDPAAGKDVGEFTDLTLQDLYDDLVAQGSQSLADALLVGAAIEEIDIADLEDALVNTEQTDIIRVYESLKKGSENHLRAFVSTLGRQTGQVYEAQYLEQADYEDIMDGSAGYGKGRRSVGRGRGGRF